VSGASGSAFSSAQYDEAYPPGVERSFWHVARNAIIAEELARAGMDRAPLLEIGCGPGIVVGSLRAKGMDCTGCDLAEPLVPESVRPFVRTGTDFRSLPDEARRRVKGALLCDVLEHLREPRLFLRDVVEGLPSLTHLLVTVPARKELWSDWDDHYGHFRRYDPSGLELDLEGAGLAPLGLRYFFHALYAPMLLARGRRRSTTIAAPKARGVHELLGRAFVLEGRLLPPWVPGTSLVAIARVTARTPT
jgi:hypothetical protein